MAKQYATLDENNNVIPTDDAMRWGRWFEVNRERRTVKREKVGDSEVSTVFMGLDHSFGEGPPLWFETMIFGGVHDSWQQRCETWAEAVVMHAEGVKVAALEV